MGTRLIVKMIFFINILALASAKLESVGLNSSVSDLISYSNQTSNLSIYCLYDNQTNFCCDSDNETYQDWMAKGSEWNEEKSINMFNYKCPTSGDFCNYFISGKYALTLNV